MSPDKNKAFVCSQPREGCNSVTIGVQHVKCYSILQEERCCIIHMYAIIISDRLGGGESVCFVYQELMR